MIEHILILTSDGSLILMRSYVDSSISRHLISGFLSAIDSFSKETLSSSLNRIKLQDKYVVFKRKSLIKRDILFVLVTSGCLSSDNLDDCYCVPTTLKMISEEFIQRYATENFDLLDTGKFIGFEDFVDSVVDKHFNTHFCLTNAVQQFNENRDVENKTEALKGFVYFIDGQLISYGLSPDLQHIRFQLLMSHVRLWQKLLKNDALIPSKNILEFEKFKVMFTHRKFKYYLFSFWETELTAKMLNNFHYSLFSSLLQNEFTTDS